MKNQLLPAILAFSLSCACNRPYTGIVVPDPHPHESEKEEVAELPFKPGISKNIHSISSGPGADASSNVCVSWATDTGMKDTYVLYARESDKYWKEAVKVAPEQHYLCDVFDGVASVDANGNEMTEKVRFYKNGANLTGLRADTDYKYVIMNSSGDRSREGKFRTAGAESWSCCLISDFHSYPPLPKRLVCSMAMIDKIQQTDPSLDWVLSAGDVVSWGGSYSFWKRFFEEDNCAELMWARANGNHDNWTKVSQETGNYDIPNDYFKGTSYYPQNGYAGEEGVCYHFRYGNTMFVMLNTENMSSGTEFNNAVKWTKEVITKEKSGNNPPTFTVVCMHYEWFYGTNGKSSQYERWHSIFDQLGVDLAYAGNNHVYLRSKLIYNGKVSSNGKGTLYLQTPSSDNDRGRTIDSEDFRNSDLIECRWSEGSHSVGAVHMSVTKKKICLTLYDRNGKVVDKTEIDAKK